MARCGFQQAIQVLYQSGFSGTRVSDQPHKLSVRNLQTDIVQSLHRQGSVSAVYIVYMI